MPKGKTIELNYSPHPTLREFHVSESFHRCVMGPRGSGKSTAMCMEVFTRGMEEQSGESRFVICRNTYGELERTTIKTWLQWFPEEFFGKINRNTMTHDIRYGDKHIEVMFIPFDKPKDVKKALSLETTGVWINEAREVPYGLISGLADTIGRYPPGGNPSWYGMILDTNPPDDDHWWYALAERDEETANKLGIDLDSIDLRSWQFWKQPGGLLEIGGRFEPNPQAENIENLPGGLDYYVTRAAGKKKDHIRVFYCNQYGFVIDGRPVHQDYVDATHCSHDEIAPIPGRTIFVGLDFGLTPAATLGQRLVDGRWIVFDEITTERSGIKRFAEERLGPLLRGPYRGYEVEIYGDPAGTAESQTDEQSPFDILEACGIKAEPAYHNNDPVVRRESLAAPLRRMVDGKPGFLLSPRCRMLRKALKGGYAYKRVQVSGEDRFKEKPDKNRYSHVAESCEYMVLGAGEGEALVSGTHDSYPAGALPGAPSGRGFRLPRGTGTGGGWML